MSDRILHDGVVESVVDDCVRVRIIQSSACSGCKVVGHCNASESKVKIVDVFTPDSSSYRLGQPVIVSASKRVATIALLFGFGLPLFLLIVTLLIAIGLTGDEGLSALCALGILIPYYFGVWLMRDRLGHQVSFEISSSE